MTFSRHATLNFRHPHPHNFCFHLSVTCVWVCVCGLPTSACSVIQVALCQHSVMKAPPVTPAALKSKHTHTLQQKGNESWSWQSAHILWLPVIHFLSHSHIFHSASLSVYSASVHTTFTNTDESSELGGEVPIAFPIRTAVGRVFNSKRCEFQSQCMRLDIKVFVSSPVWLNSCTL